MSANKLTLLRLWLIAWLLALNTEMMNTTREGASGVVDMVKKMLCGLFKETSDAAEALETERAHKMPMSQQGKGIPTQLRSTEFAGERTTSQMFQFFTWL